MVKIWADLALSKVKFRIQVFLYFALTQSMQMLFWFYTVSKSKPLQANKSYHALHSIVFKDMQTQYSVQWNRQSFHHDCLVWNRSSFCIQAKHRSICSWILCSHLISIPNQLMNNLLKSMRNLPNPCLWYGGMIIMQETLYFCWQSFSCGRER